MMLLTARNLTTDELSVLRSELDRQRRRYRADPAAADRLISVGESAVDETLDPVELAAFTAVARAILNLDEVLCKS
jgi:hypothetical protein